MANINSSLLASKRTSVFVAHRLKTISDADVIIVLQDGRIEESGTHDELIHKQGGLYADMWRAQNELE